MRRRNVLTRCIVLILILISTTILSTGCRSLRGPELECKRPSPLQKESWKTLRRAVLGDPVFGPGVDWISEILEEDCFPDEAEEARHGS